MRGLERNKQKFYYALYTGKAEIVDADGNRTGQFVEGYTDPVAISANISAARGMADMEQFGIEANYSRVICLYDMSCPIDTDSILWIDITPDEDGEAGAVKHNYAVVTVATSLNHKMIAVREVIES